MSTRERKGLTVADIRNAKPKVKPYKLADAHSLYLYVTPADNKVWRFRYVFQGRERTMVFGPWPNVSLADARKALADAKAILRDGRDPAVEKKLANIQAGETGEKASFRYWAEDWLAVRERDWTGRYHKNVSAQMATYVYPALGALPIQRIRAFTILDLIRKVEKESPSTAQAVRMRISCVFQHAAAPMDLDADPAALLRRQCLRPVTKHHPAAETLGAARAVLGAIEGDPGGHALIKLAHRLLVLTTLRSSELRGARWSEFSGLGGDTPLWVVPGARMKGQRHKKRDHVVPLSAEAVEVLSVVRTLHRDQTWVFPGPKTRRDAAGQTAGPINPLVFEDLLKRVTLPVPHVPHGWRSSFLTLMNEAYPEDRHILDGMLAHKPSGVSAAEAVYNRAQHQDRRRVLASAWARLILADAPDAWAMVGLAKPAAEIVPLSAAA